MGCCESWPENPRFTPDQQRQLEYWERVARDAETAQAYAYKQIEAIINEEDSFIRGEGL